MMASVKELLEMVKAASGPDREIDLALTNAFDRHESGYLWRWGGQAVAPGSKDIAVLDAPDEDMIHLIGDNRSVIIPPKRTASIDAALALTERLLPGWTIAHLTQQDDKTWFCELREGFLTSYNRVAMSETGYGKNRPKTLPLAILQALLSALSTKEG